MDVPDFELDTSLLGNSKTLDSTVYYDLVIVGGGPAAMSAAVYAARKMLNCAVITRDFGGQVLETSEIENWLGFQSINARDLVASFVEHVNNFDMAVASDMGVAGIEKEGDIFRIKTEDGNVYSARAVILATGKRHRPLAVPGEKELVGRGVAYCATCDAPLFRDKEVVVVGGGNSAFTTAVDLLKVGAGVVMVNFIEGWQADEALQERVHRAENAKLFDYHQVVRIEGKTSVEGVVIQEREKGEEKLLKVEGVFVEIGLLPNSESVKNLVALNDLGEVIIDCSCRTDVEGFFGAGDVTTVPHKQIIISAGEGAKAALSAYDYLMKHAFV
ncbi:MAG: FAD-dependent oxidoreductase [Deltaproteobacteria bacterium]|nr:FAD-dependent oxidoreductase [Deltaproteobacteria bacterium]MBN2844529.1 FAD-dependent oxidoreductase [Deltaproteobacteria bacterium]